MEIFNRARYDECECVEVFRRMFPHGFAGADVMSEVAPEGWERSPLVAVFHPTVEQVFEEAVQSHHHMRELKQLLGKAKAPDHSDAGDEDDSDSSDSPTLAEIRARFQTTPIEPDR